MAMSWPMCNLKVHMKKYYMYDNVVYKVAIRPAGWAIVVDMCCTPGLVKFYIQDTSSNFL